MEWTEVRSRGSLFNFSSGSNHHYVVEIRDYTPVLDYIMSYKPEREIGQRYADWKRGLDNYNEYRKPNPYTIIVTFHGDDDMTLIKEFSDIETAISEFEEISTSNTVPSFDGYI